MNTITKYILASAVALTAFKGLFAADGLLPDGRYRLILFQDGPDNNSGGVIVNVIKKDGVKVVVTRERNTVDEGSQVKENAGSFTFSTIQPALGIQGNAKNTYTGSMTSPAEPQLAKGYYSSEAPGFSAKGFFIMFPEKG